MSWAIDLAWKSAVIAAAALLLLRMARGRSAAQRSFVAHLGLLAVVALPPATLLLPAWTPLPAEQLPALVAQAEPIAAPLASELPLPADRTPALPVALYLYALPALLLLAALLTAVGRLFRMRRRAAVLVDAPWLTALAGAQARMGFKHGTALLVSDELRSPISWGVLRPTIVLDPGAVAAAGEAEAIIAHELAHVARLDWAKLLLARLACALFWFNPLVWLLARESHQLREEAADDAVLLADVADADYAALLVNAARHDHAGALLAAHGVAPSRGSLKRRIARVLDRSSIRTPVGAGFAALGLMLMAGLAGPLAAFGPTAPVAAAVAAPATVPTPPAEDLHEPIVAAAPEKAAQPVALASPPQPRKAAVAGHERAQQPRPVVASLDDIVAAKALGVQPGHVDRFAAIFPGVRLRDVVAAQAVGVTPDYAQALRRRFPTADLRDVVRMRAVGVSGHDVESFADPRGPALVEMRGPKGSVRVEANTRGRTVTRVRHGDREVVTDVSAEFPEPPEPPEPN